MSQPIVRRAVTAVATAFLVSILLPPAAADNVQNDVVATGNGTVVVGASTTVNYRITSNNGDGQTGCNAADTTPATLTINAPSPVVATPGSLSFTACAAPGSPNAKPVSFSSPVAGNYSITVSVSDAGVGSYNPTPAAFTLRVLADTVPPTIVATVLPAAGASGWHNLATGAPTISFACSDATSAIVLCSPSVTLGEGAGQTVTGQAKDAAGNQASLVVGPIHVDLAAPSISADPAPAGWSNIASGAPTAHFVCSDALSGIASCTPDQLLGEGADQVVDGTASDIAGNSASATAGPADIDLTAPSIEASLSPDAAESGWYNIATGAPMAHFECSDDLSGIASCSEDEELGEGAGRSAEGSAHDHAGNSASATAGPVDIDLTAPSIVAHVSHDAASSGWYNLAVGAPTVSFECSDDLSGIASCSADVTLGEGLGQMVSGQAMDAAGNAVSIEVGPFDVDLTPPSISADLPGEGWYSLGDSPSASFQCSDALSGLASCPAAELLGEGEGQVVDGTAYDVAGNSASAQAGPFDVDFTLPSIEASISPDLPASGWYNIASGAPLVHFECSDALSGVASCSADEELGEGEDQSATGYAEDVAGNDNSASSEPVDVDLTAPSIEASLSPDPAASGWYNLASGAPTAHYECSDDLSGIASCPEDEVLGEGAGQSAEGSAADQAGNSASASAGPADIDLTAPSIVGSLSPDAAESGWYNIATGAPTASFECDDALSGVASCSGSSVLGEGAAQAAEGSASDVAGNTASAIAGPADIDLTAPSIEASLSSSSAESGWYNIATGAPTASFDCDDALSGIASCTDPIVLDEGLAQSAEGTAIDVAGNERSASSSPVDIDLTAPELSLPADFTVGATGVSGAPASFSVSASDNLDSDPDVSCSAESGALFAPGPTTVTCEATDEAGNEATGSFVVTVRYTAAGFYQPALSSELNVVKAGSTVPLKFSVRTASGALIGDLAAVGSFSAKSVACAPLLPDPIEFVTTGGTSLRYDSSSGQFIQNWKTPSAKGCLRASVTLADGSVLSAVFQLK